MPRRLAALALLLALWPSSASADNSYYDPLQAGHPLRIAAYALHPIGYALDSLLFRPAWHVGQSSVLRAVFGVEPSPEALEPQGEQSGPEAGPPS
jgi:hypothetical protein